MKAVAVHTIVIVVIIAISLFFSLVIFWHWLNLQQIEATREACAIKLMNYCTEWYRQGFGNRPYNWDDVAPKEDCDQFDIDEPEVDDCKSLLGIE